MPFHTCYRCVTRETCVTFSFANALRRTTTHLFLYSCLPFKQPNVYERIAQNPEFTSLIDMEELKHALSAVQEDIRSLPLYVPVSFGPLMRFTFISGSNIFTLHDVSRVRGRSAGLSALLKILYTDPDVLLPQHLSPEQVVRWRYVCDINFIGKALLTLNLKWDNQLGINDAKSLPYALYWSRIDSKNCLLFTIGM